MEAADTPERDEAAQAREQKDDICGIVGHSLRSRHGDAHGTGLNTGKRLRRAPIADPHCTAYQILEDTNLSFRIKITDAIQDPDSMPDHFGFGLRVTGDIEEAGARIPGAERRDGLGRFRFPVSMEGDGAQNYSVQ